MLIYSFTKGARNLKTAMLFITLLATTALPAAGSPIILEAEDYIGSFNVGGEPFYVTFCSGASGGLAVEGYDYPGDYIDFMVVLPQAGTYNDTLRSGGLLYEFSSHFATFRRPNSGTLAYSQYHTMGMGIG
jgi:hypothetical protein